MSVPIRVLGTQSSTFPFCFRASHALRVVVRGQRVCLRLRRRADASYSEGLGSSTSSPGGETDSGAPCMRSKNISQVS
jgi:hypothetical protein